MKIEYQHYIDEPYFRLYHNLRDLSAPTLPKGYSRCEATIADFAAHINFCYDSICISEAELQCYAAHRCRTAVENGGQKPALPQSPVCTIILLIQKTVSKMWILRF